MNLDFTLTEAGDGLLVYITDTTEDWEVGGIQDVFDNGDAYLDIVIKGVAYDRISIKSYFDGANQEDLVFEITPDILLIGGDQAGSTLPDGDWSVSYYAEHTVGGAVSDSVSEYYLVYSIIEKAVLDEMRLINLNDYQWDHTQQEALIVGAHYVYLQGIKNAAYQSDIPSVRTALTNLENMVVNRLY